MRDASSELVDATRIYAVWHSWHIQEDVPKRNVREVPFITLFSVYRSGLLLLIVRIIVSCRPVWTRTDHYGVGGHVHILPPDIQSFRSAKYHTLIIGFIADFSLFGSRCPGSRFALVVISSMRGTVHSQATQPTAAEEGRSIPLWNWHRHHPLGLVAGPWSGPNVLISPYSWSYMIYMELLLQLHHKHT
jgi:hypothetical protein